MNVKDLEIAEELGGEARSAVRGGSNLGLLGGAVQFGGGSGVSIGSPQIQVAPQIVTQIELPIDINTIFASANTGISQAQS